jgi:hypothetical protein
MAERFDINFPVGRFVSGSFTEKRTTDMDNRPIDPAKQRFEFGMAYPKVVDGQHGPIVQIIMDIAAYAKSATPAHAAQIDHWLQTFTGYSMKISDGDKPNRDGKVNENTAGHYVFWFSTGLDIKLCRIEGNQSIQIPNDSVKRGWFFDMTGNVVPNGEVGDRAGVYLNPEWIRLIAEGDEIVGGRSADDAFAGRMPPAQLPAGARPLGSAPATPPPGSTMGLPGAPAATPPGAPATSQTAPGLPGAGAPAPGSIPSSTTASPSSLPSGAPAVQHPPHHGALGGGLPGAG